MVRKNNIWAVFGVAAVLFISGGVVGFFLDRMLPPEMRKGPMGPPPSADRIKVMMVERISEQLTLDPSQCRRIAPDIDAWFEEMEALHRIHAPQYAAVFNKLFDRIGRILNSPEQQEKMQQFRREFEEEHIRGPRGPQGPPPPPFRPRPGGPEKP